eukprot:1160942-Pelagomonas_calceolata.AAC.6
MGQKEECIILLSLITFVDLPLGAALHPLPYDFTHLYLITHLRLIGALLLQSGVQAALLITIRSAGCCLHRDEAVAKAAEEQAAAAAAAAVVASAEENSMGGKAQLYQELSEFKVNVDDLA